jgi:hypothetical protein
MTVKRSGKSRHIPQLFGKRPKDVRILSQVNKGKSTAFPGLPIPGRNIQRF